MSNTATLVARKIPSRKSISVSEALESRYQIKDEESFFRNLVNPSLSKNLPYYGWSRYREAYSGELVKELIRRSNLDPTKHFVYDPMSGSGSTLLGSLELGFDAVGNDINPYAVDMANAKLHSYSKSDIQIVQEFANSSTIPSLKGKPIFKKTMEYCKKYFPEGFADNLQLIIDQIARVPNDNARNLLTAIWLTILEDCSNRKKDGNGLATRETKVKDVWMHFCKAVSNVLSDLQNNPLPKGGFALSLLDTVYNASDILASFSNKRHKQLGAIIFSPPYANSFDYFESYKLELLCGYFSPAELNEKRKQAIRSYRQPGRRLQTSNLSVAQLCDEIESRIPLKEARTGVIDGRNRLVPNLIIGYFEDMERSIIEFANSMPKGSYCYIVVDQSAYLGVIVPSDLLLAELGEKHGLEVESIIRCRSAKTSGQQLREFPYLRDALRESIVVLKK